jgi:hypothetical protein
MGVPCYAAHRHAAFAGFPRGASVFPFPFSRFPLKALLRRGPVLRVRALPDGMYPGAEDPPRRYWKVGY